MVRKMRRRPTVCPSRRLQQDGTAAAHTAVHTKDVSRREQIREVSDLVRDPAPTDGGKGKPSCRRFFSAAKLPSRLPIPQAALSHRKTLYRLNLQQLLPRFHALPAPFRDNLPHSAPHCPTLFLRKMTKVRPHLSDEPCGCSCTRRPAKTATSADRHRNSRARRCIG